MKFIFLVISLGSMFSESFKLNNHHQYRRKFSTYDSYGDGEIRGLSPKVLGTIFILTIGVFGTGFIGNIGKTLGELKAGTQSFIVEPKLKGSSENRGALTSLTRREINTKLQAIPVFFGTSDNGLSVYTKDGIGFFFMEEDDAKSYFSQNDKSVKVAATALDEVYFTLIEKKAKLGKFIEGLSGTSDKTATYILQPSVKELPETSSKWRQLHSNDVPLYRVPNLVFSKEDGLQFPLFFRKSDALQSFRMLQESKKAPSDSIPAVVDVQETSLQDIIKLFQGGGFEGRSLEFYPSITAIENARRLMGI